MAKGKKLPAKKGSQGSTTPGGNPTAASRKRSSATGDGRFPIENKHQAESAIKLRGHASPEDQKKILRKAAKFDPEAAKKAREKDKDK